MSLDLPRLTVVVGSGGVGKTTLAAALALLLAERGEDTLVMTFDPSHRLKDSLGVGDVASGGEVPVRAGTAGRLHASMLDAAATFDRLVARYAPDEAARDRILRNRFYRELAGSLAGILEYMAVERLFEAARADPDRRIVLDTPPTSQALDFLEAPRRIVSFLDSGAIQLALRPWFREDGRLRTAARLGKLGRRLEAYLDELIGLDLLREMAEFFQAFGPLFDGFRGRALEVEELLRSPETTFLLVAGPGEQRAPDALYFARRLVDSGHRLGAVIVNRVHPRLDVPPTLAGPAADATGEEILAWLGEQDAAGLAHLRSLLPPGLPVPALPLLPEEPADLEGVRRVAAEMGARARRGEEAAG